MQVQRELQARNPGEMRSKLVLLVVFLLGAALVWAGIWGVDQVEASGFDQESAYGILYELSPEMDKVYEEDILPYLNKLDESKYTVSPYMDIGTSLAAV